MAKKSSIEKNNRRRALTARDLKKRTELKATLQQVLLICLGVGSILLVGELVGH